MTAAQWNEAKHQSQWGTSIFYDYYNEMKQPHHRTLSESEFARLFTEYVNICDVNSGNIQPIPNSAGSLTVFNSAKICARIKEHFNRKFNT